MEWKHLGNLYGIVLETTGKPTCWLIFPTFYQKRLWVVDHFLTGSDIGGGMERDGVFGHFLILGENPHSLGDSQHLGSFQDYIFSRKNIV